MSSLEPLHQPLATSSDEFSGPLLSSEPGQTDSLSTDSALHVVELPDSAADSSDRSLLAALINLPEVLHIPDSFTRELQSSLSPAHQAKLSEMHQSARPLFTRLSKSITSRSHLTQQWINVTAAFSLMALITSIVLFALNATFLAIVILCLTVLPISFSITSWYHLYQSRIELQRCQFNINEAWILKYNPSISKLIHQTMHTQQSWNSKQSFTNMLDCTHDCGCDCDCESEQDVESIDNDTQLIVYIGPTGIIVGSKLFLPLQTNRYRCTGITLKHNDSIQGEREREHEEEGVLNHSITLEVFQFSFARIWSQFHVLLPLPHIMLAVQQEVLPSISLNSVILLHLKRQLERGLDNIQVGESENEYRQANGDADGDYESPDLLHAHRPRGCGIECFGYPIIKMHQLSMINRIHNQFIVSQIVRINSFPHYIQSVCNIIMQ